MPIISSPVAPIASGDIQLTALGLLAQSGDPDTYDQVQAPATQNVYGRLLGLRAGMVVTGVALWNSTPAAGTLPTLVRAGIADANGKMLVVSGNASALAIWDGGRVKLPLAAPYTVLATGGYYVCYVVNGVWGTTPPTPARGSAANYVGYTAPGAPQPGLPSEAFVWGGQTDLPAVGASLTTSGTGTTYWTAVY